MNLSDKSYFSQDELDSLHTWTNLENFGSEEVEDEQTRVLTVDEIEAMQQQAYDEAFAQGQKEGFAKGQEAGLEQGKKDGYQLGFDEGAKKGYEENVHLLRKQCGDFVSLLEALAEPFRELDENVEQQLVQLAIGIASQLVRRELKIDPGQIVAVIRESVQALPLSSQQIKLSMHPDDAELVRNALAIDDISPTWKIHEDPLLTRGGCIVETDFSHVDATVENRMAAIVASILGGDRQQDRKA
jgi:flagellar assembly protein FliH